MGRGIRRAALLTALILMLASPVERSVAAPADVAHLPDIRTLPPSDLRITDGERGSRHLRLTNTVWNAGDGPLELRAVNAGTTTAAYQRVYTHDASGARRLAYEREVGTFEFHPSHDHWHFRGFARYEVRSVAADGGIGRTLRSSEKIGFCMIPTRRVSKNLEHYGWGGNYRCGRGELQGLPVGWGDDYRWSLPGQSIDVTGLPPGRYWLVSSADVEQRLEEIDESNNAVSVLIRLTKDGVKRID